MFLPSITAVLAARAQVTVRHGGHDEPYPTTSSLLTSTGSTYPSNNTTAGQSKVTSQLPQLLRSYPCQVVTEVAIRTQMPLF
jgi:hypothetical protein